MKKLQIKNYPQNYQITINGYNIHYSTYKGLYSIFLVLFEENKYNINLHLYRNFGQIGTFNGIPVKK